MMQDLVSLLANPLLWKILVAYFVYSAFAGALPMPDSGAKNFLANPFYKFAFAFFNGLAANISRAARTFKVPGAE